MADGRRRRGWRGVGWWKEGWRWKAVRAGKGTGLESGNGWKAQHWEKESGRRFMKKSKLEEGSSSSG
jgi:hypothetical protein